MDDDSEFYENMFVDELSSGAYYLKHELGWTVDRHGYQGKLVSSSSTAAYPSSPTDITSATAITIPSATTWSTSIDWTCTYCVKSLNR